MEQQSRTFAARWIFPVSGPPLERGTITIRGEHIEAVEPHGVRTPDVDLGNVAIIPGLINVHTHLDLSGARGKTPPTDADHFTDWLRSVIAFRRSRTPEQTQADIPAGLAECLKQGTTLLGDITVGGASYPAVSTAPVRAVLFWELIGLTEERFHQARRRCIQMQSTVYPYLYERCRWGFSPHSPYSANHEAITHVLTRGGDEAIITRGGDVTMHLAESTDELELIQSKGGQFVSFLKDLGVWEPEAFSLTLDAFVNHEWVRRSGVSQLYIHCNYLSPEVRFDPQQTLVYCPRTHAAFGHPPHPFQHFFARGVRICLATDGLSSNPDLDVLAEARFVHERYSDFPTDALLRMVTLSGAEALRWDDEVGSLTPGKSADFVVIPLPNRDEIDPHELVLGEDFGPRRTMFRGEWRDS